MEHYGKLRMENTTPPHNKFYEISFYFENSYYQVVSVWGRIPIARWNVADAPVTSPNMQRKAFNRTQKVRATSYIKALIKTRIKHGYHIVGVPTLLLD